MSNIHYDTQGRRWWHIIGGKLWECEVVAEASPMRGRCRHRPHWRQVVQEGGEEREVVAEQRWGHGPHWR
jgi:hypothetical protein